MDYPVKNQPYIFIDKDGTIKESATKQDLANYLPLSGGILSGALQLKDPEGTVGNPNNNNVPLNFRDIAITNSEQKIAWMKGTSTRIESGYGLTTTLGQSRGISPEDASFYIGQGWDGAQDKFFYFTRNGDLQVPGNIESTGKMKAVGGLESQAVNKFISSGNEFNFIGDDYNDGNGVFINFKGGNVNEYIFCNGRNDHGTAPIKATDFINSNNNSMYSPDNKPTPQAIGALLQGSYERIENGVDLNNYKKAGFYNVKCSSVLNVPTGVSIDAVLLVYPWNDNNISMQYVTQELTESASSLTVKRWVRNFCEGVWTSWKKIYSEDQKPTPEEIGALPLVPLLYDGDLNTLYNFRGGFRGGATNKPLGIGDGFINVIRFDYRNFCEQIVYSAQDQHMWLRQSLNADGTEWSSWEKVVKSSSSECQIGERSQTPQTFRALRDNGTSGNWSMASDERVKEDIQDADTSICYNDIKRLKVRRFKYKDFIPTIDKHVTGFIAQEFEKVFPKSINKRTSSFEERDAEGNIIYETKQVKEIELINGKEVEKIIDKEVPKTVTIEDFMTIDITQINHTLVGAVQQLMNKVEALEEEVKLLKK